MKKVRICYYDDDDNLHQVNELSCYYEDDDNLHQVNELSHIPIDYGWSRLGTVFQQLHILFLSTFLSLTSVFRHNWFYPRQP